MAIRGAFKRLGVGGRAGQPAKSGALTGEAGGRWFMAGVGGGNSSIPCIPTPKLLYLPCWWEALSQAPVEFALLQFFGGCQHWEGFWGGGGVLRKGDSVFQAAVGEEAGGDFFPRGETCPASQRRCLRWHKRDPSPPALSLPKGLETPLPAREGCAKTLPRRSRPRRRLWMRHLPRHRTPGRRSQSAAAACCCWGRPMAVGLELKQDKSVITLIESWDSWSCSLG